MSIADQINDGGPAFPLQPTAKLAFEGVSKLDYFAGKALQALLGEASYMRNLAAECADDFDKVRKHVAWTAYKYGEAMLEERFARAERLTNPNSSNEPIPIPGIMDTKSPGTVPGHAGYQGPPLAA